MLMILLPSMVLGMEPPDSSSLSSEADQISIADFESADPDDENNILYLYQLLTTPNSGDLVRIRDRGQRWSRTEERYHYLALDRGPVRLNVLESHLLGKEIQTLRNVHAALTLEQTAFTLIAGHFRVNMGEGWTVQSSPSFSLPSSPSAPFHRSLEGISANTSAEPLRGWVGGAVDCHIQGSSALPTINMWAGNLLYDADRESNGDYSLYSSLLWWDKKEERVWETQAGMSITQPLGYGSQLQLIRSTSHFSEDLAPTETARYRFSDQTPLFGATGIAFRHTGKHLLLRGETTRQDHKAYGGGASGAYKTDRTGTFSVATWRATKAFATLHARPYLPFGSDPAGEGGYQAGWAGGYGIASLIAVNYARNLGEKEFYSRRVEQESGFEEYYYQYTPSQEALWLTLHLDLLPELTLELRGTVRNETEFLDSYDELRHPKRHSIRTALRHSTSEGTIIIRGQYVASSTGVGRLYGLEWRSGKLRGVGFRAAATYLLADSYDARVTVVEPSAPGAFPFTTLTGEHLRVAGRLDLFASNGIILWASGSVDQDFDGYYLVSRLTNSLEYHQTSAFRWGLGFDWRPVL